MVEAYESIMVTARYEFASDRVVELELAAIWEKKKLSVSMHSMALNGVKIAGLPEVLIKPTNADRALVENRLGTSPLEIGINMSALEGESDELKPVCEVECFDQVLVLEASEKRLIAEIRKSKKEKPFTKLSLSAEAREPGVADKFVCLPSEGWEIQLG